MPNLTKKASSAVEAKIGQRIKELRKKAGISQESLALKADLDRTYINSVENGRRNISIKSLEKIADALEISLSKFFAAELFKASHKSDEQ